MFLFRSLLCVLCLVLSLSLVLVPVLVSAQTSTANRLEVSVDQVSATTARIRFLNAEPSQQTATLIQYTANAGRFTSLTRSQYHSCITFDAAGCPSGTVLTSDDHEVNITQGILPITSYILRGLKPSTTYQVRVAYIDTSNPPQVLGTAAARSVTTRALSTSTSLSSFLASGGCGSLVLVDGVITSMYNVTTSVVGSERIYQCSVAYDVTSVTLSVTAATPYSPITPNITTLQFNQTIQPLALSAREADPFIIYTHNITLAGEGATSTFSFIVGSEVSGTNQTHTLSILRVPKSTTSTLRGPTSPVTSMIRTPSIPSSYDYRALLWEGTSVSASSWKVWSDDLTIFPYSAFNITFPHTTGAGEIDYSFLRVLVSPTTSHSDPSTCSAIHVGLFPSSVATSDHVTICVTVLKDDCSTQPAGVATSWTTYFDTNGVPQQQLFYNPPPPTPTFPKA